MPILRRSEQNQQSLQDFYREFLPKPGDTFGNAGIPMLRILDFMNDTFRDTFIYGLTSHVHLLLFKVIIRQFTLACLKIRGLKFSPLFLSS